MKHFFFCHFIIYLLLLLTPITHYFSGGCGVLLRWGGEGEGGEEGGGEGEEEGEEEGEGERGEGSVGRSGESVGGGLVEGWRERTWGVLTLVRGTERGREWEMGIGERVVGGEGGGERGEEEERETRFREVLEEEREEEKREVLTRDKTEKE